MREFTKIIINFIQYAFLLFLISAFILYFIVGNKIGIIYSIMKTMVPVAYFAMVLLIFTRKEQDRVEKLKKEAQIEEILMYFSKVDQIKDLMVVFSLPIIIIFISYFNKTISMTDFYQGIAAFTLMFFWDLYLFRKKDGVSKIMYLTNFDKTKDQIIIFFLPLLMVVISALALKTGLIDSIQALVVFLLMYGWHKFLFRATSRW